MNYVKFKSVRTLLRITHLAHRKSYLVIICPNSHEKFTKSEIRLSYYLFQFDFIHPYLHICFFPFPRTLKRHHHARAMVTFTSTRMQPLHAPISPPAHAQASPSRARKGDFHEHSSRAHTCVHSRARSSVTLAHTRLHALHASFILVIFLHLPLSLTCSVVDLYPTSKAMWILESH